MISSDHTPFHTPLSSLPPRRPAKSSGRHTFSCRKPRRAASEGRPRRAAVACVWQQIILEPGMNGHPPETLRPVSGPMPCPLGPDKRTRTVRLYGPGRTCPAARTVGRRPALGGSHGSPCPTHRPTRGSHTRMSWGVPWAWRRCFEGGDGKTVPRRTGGWGFMLKARTSWGMGAGLIDVCSVWHGAPPIPPAHHASSPLPGRTASTLWHAPEKSERRVSPPCMTD